MFSTTNDERPFSLGFFEGQPFLSVGVNTKLGN